MNITKALFDTFPEVCVGRPPGTNTIVFSVLNREIGLSYDINTKKISVRLNHPLAKFWLSIFEPIWRIENEDKCKTCHGSGWDGETYSITCMKCGETGKKV